MGGIWFNKALNAMVVLARTNSGLEKLPDTNAVRQITGTGAMALLRRVARFVPFHRIFHSIELTLVSLVVGVLFGIVFGIFAQVSVRTRFGDRGDDIRAVLGLEAMQLGLEFFSALDGEGNGRAHGEKRDVRRPRKDEARKKPP